MKHLRFSRPISLPKLCMAKAFLLVGMLFALLPALSRASPQASPQAPIPITQNWQYLWGDCPQDPTGLFACLPPNRDNPRANWLVQERFPETPPGRNDTAFMWQKTRLPNANLRRPYLYVDVVQQNMQIFLDGKLIYTFGDLDSPGEVFLGYPWHMLPLPPDYAGKDLTFRIWSGHHNIGLQGSIFLGDEDAILKHIVILPSQNTLVVAVITLFIGLIGFALYSGRRANPEYLFFGLFAASIAIGMFASCPFSLLILHDSILWSWIELTMLFTAAPALVGLIDSLFTAGAWNILRRIWQIMAIYGAVALLAGATGIIPFMNTLLPLQLMIVFAFIVIIITISRKALQGQRDALTLIIGFTVLLFGICIDIIIALGAALDQFKGSAIGTPWGMLALVLAFGLILIGRFLEVYRRTMEHERNLVRLATEGRKISAQGTLLDLVKQTRDSVGKIVRLPILSTIFFDHTAFVGADFPAGFYALNEQGNIHNKHPISLDQVRTLAATTLLVQDARSGETIAAVALRGTLDSDDIAKAGSLLDPITNNIASAITTVRLEKTFAVLAKRTEEVHTLFANINQGILLLDEDLTILPDYSSFLDTLFPATTIARTNFINLITQQFSLTPDLTAQVSTCLSGSLGEDELSWDSNAHVLPSETCITRGEDTIIIEIDWTPLCDGDGVVRRLMVTFRDVTTLKALKAAAEANKREMEILGQIVHVGREKFEGFILSTQHYVEDSLKALAAPAVPSDEDFREIKRHLHTIKGNSRTLRFSLLTDLAHEVEAIAADVVLGRKPCETLREDILTISATVEKYARVARDLLYWTGTGNAVIMEALDASKTLTRRVADMPELTNEIRTEAEQLITKLIHLTSPTLGKIITSLRESLSSLAAEAGRPAPSIIIENNHDWILSAETSQILEGALMHLTRNSLDHGFSDGRDGVIHVSLQPAAGNGNSALIYWDTGPGINLDKLHELGKRQGTLTNTADDNDIANMIFISGVSTADVVTLISGRGVGMGAVRSQMERAGMPLNLEFTGPRNEHGFRPFRLIFTVPKERIVQSL